MAGPLMKSCQPKAGGVSPEDEGPGDPSGIDTAADPPSQPEPETGPLPRATHQHCNAEVDFCGEKRSNATHVSTTDSEARLYKRSPGTSAMLCFMGGRGSENGSWDRFPDDGADGEPQRTDCAARPDPSPLSADCCAITCRDTDGPAERRAALDMIHRHSPGSTRRLTPGADKGYDTAVFVADLRKACVTPHVAQKSRYSAIPSRRMHAFACRAVDGRTTRHEGYAQSIQHRKRIDVRRENDPPDRFLILLTFGWAKTIGDMAQTVYRGAERVWSRFILTMAANNLARLPGLLAA